MIHQNDEEYDERIQKNGSFIDAEFLERILSENLEDKNIKVVDYSFRAAVKPGNNYFGLLYKTNVKYKTGNSKKIKTLNLMIKGPPPEGTYLTLAESFNAFDNESNMYNKTLPAMHKVIREHFQDGLKYVGANSYQCHRKDTIVMEDLQAIGYKMKSRYEQLDYDHIVVVMRTLARFHASSLKVREENPELLSNVSKETFYSEENKAMITPLVAPRIKSLADEVEGWGEVAIYSQQIRNVSKFIDEKLVALMLPSRYFNVLTHGDAWTNNIMFRYHDNGQIESCRLVDLQLTRVTTPVLDIIYALFSSVQPDAITNHMFEILDIYHKALMSDLETLGVNANYPIQRLHQDLRERSAYGVVVLSMYLPGTIAPSGGIDINAESANYMKHSHFIEVCSKLLMYFASIGYLEDARVYTLHIEDKARRLQEAGEYDLKNGGKITKKNSNVWYAFEQFFED